MLIKITSNALSFVVMGLLIASFPADAERNTTYLNLTCKEELKFTDNAALWTVFAEISYASDCFVSYPYVTDKGINVAVCWTEVPIVRAAYKAICVEDFVLKEISAQEFRSNNAMLKSE